MIPILMYHQVSPQPQPAFTKYIVTPTTFAQQMRWLALARYTPITFDHLIEHRAGRRRLPPRPVIITFDDGFQDCADYAVPILQQHGFSAIFYLVAGLMGQTSRWLRTERNIELPLMDWATARQLQADGFVCGAHTMTHPHLAELSPAAQQAELHSARHRLEDELGHPIRHLAYPYGSFNAATRVAAMETGYLTACSVQIGLSSPGDDLFALHRVPVNGGDSLLDFVWRLRTAYALKDWLFAQTHAVRQHRQHKGSRR